MLSVPEETARMENVRPWGEHGMAVTEGLSAEDELMERGDPGGEA